MTFVLALSLLLQLGAAVLALRLTRLTGKRGMAWILVAAAILLMAIRRAITLTRVIAGDVEYEPDVTEEFVALAISVLMVAGLAWIAPFFLMLQRVQDVVPQLLESAPDAMVIADEADKIALVNAQAVRLFGYRRDELLGQDVQMLIPERFRERHRERRARYRDNPRPRVLGAAAEVYGRRKDGTEFPVEISVSPLRTARGEFVASAIRNISARREAEAALKQSEGRYRAILDDVLDNSSVGVCILDAQYNVVWVNRAYQGFFGIQRQEVLGADARVLVRERLGPALEDPSEFADKVLGTYEQNDYMETFECHVLPDESRLERWLEHRSQPIPSGVYAGGRIEHYTEITERKLADQRIQQFAHIARNMQIGLVVYRMDDPDDDSTLRIVVVNPEAEDLTGIAKDQLLGRTIDEAFPQLRAHGIPQLFAEVLRSGRTQEIQDFRYGDNRVIANAWAFKVFPLPDQSVGVVFESITERKRADELVQNLAAGVAGKTGDTFFRSLVTYLAKSLGLEYAFVGEMVEDDRIATIAAYDHGAIADNFLYELRGTPCANVVGQHLCCHTEGVTQRFPEDKMLAEMNVESYVGAPLFDSDGRALGLIAVLGERQLENAETAQHVLRIFAARAAAEVERKRELSPPA